MEPIQDLPNFFSDNNPGLGGPAKTELASFFDRPPGLSAAPPRTTSKSADLGTILAQEGAEHLRPVVEAIYQQESGAGANAGVSIDGARGGMQILPDTFRRFAKAGERIDDPEDNARVGVRIIKNLARRFGDDPARIAAGYFSGEGNVNPQGGDAWKEDRADGNGKRVSGYVNDVLGRLPKAPSTPDAAGPDLSRAPKWADVMAKPEFAALSPELQAETKAAYFDYWIAPHAGQQGVDLRAQFLKAPAPQPGAPDRLPATPPGTQGLPGTADFMTEAVSAAPQERTAPPAPPELPTTSKAPVRPELRAQFQAHWDAATDQERQAMQARPGWMGMLARERAGVFEGVDRLQETLPSDNALAAVDPRVEYRRARLVRAGEAPEFADRAAREGAQAGVAPGAEIKALNGVMGATDFDFDTKALFDTKGAMTGLNNPLTRGVAKGVLGVGKAATGYMEFLADTTGADVEAERMRQAGNFLRGKEEAIGEQGDHLSRNLEGAISSIAQQLPLMVAGVKLASQAIPLAGIALQSFGQEYTDGRARGQSVAQATARASLFAAFEVIGERFGLGQQMEALRAAARGMPSDQIIGLLWSALKKEVPGELLTTTGQFATDKFVPGGVGLAPDTTFHDYAKQLADTITQTIMQSALMAGGTTGVSAGVRYVRDAGRVTSEREAEIARMKALEKWEHNGLVPQRQGDQPAAAAQAAGVTPDGRIEPRLGAVLETKPQDTPPAAPDTEPTAAAPASPGETDLAPGSPPTPPAATAGAHPLSQAADEIIRDLARDAGLPLETVLPEPVAPPPAAGDTTADTLSDQDIQDFANGRFQQLRAKRDGQIETTVGETGLTDQDIPGAGLTAEEQQELNGLMRSRGDVTALRALYGLGQDQAAGQADLAAAAPVAHPLRHELPPREPEAASETIQSEDEQAQERPIGTRAVAQRQGNAAARFVDSAVEQFGLTREEAGKAWDYYLENGLVKVDAVGGQFDLQDGRLWDGEALRRAASLPPTKSKPRTEKEARARRRQQPQQEILHGTQATQAQQAETQGPERQQAPPEPPGVDAVGADAASAGEPAVAAPKTEREAREQRRQTDILTPDGKKVAAQWDVVEADSIQASLKEGVSQPRDRGRAASDAQVQEIAGNPDFERLSDTSKTMDYGAPTLSADGLIVGGNGRFEGISRAYDGPAANAYRAALEKSAARFGLDGEAIRRMKKPVLVRRVTDHADTRQLAIQSNQAAGLQMSDMEQAALDAERMKSLELVEVSDTGDIPLTSRNMQAIKEALSGYSTNELAGMLTAEGGLSQSGIRRLRNAILFSAYGKSETLARLIESPDADMKNIGTALVRAAGKLSQVRGGIAHGGLPTEFDIAADLTAAIETLSGLRAAGERVETFLAQGDMFGGGLSPAQRAIIKFLADNLRSARAITEGLAGYAERVLSAGNSRGGLFDDVPLPTKMEVWNDATKRFANERAAAQSQQSLFDQPAPGLLADTTGGHREVPAGEGNRPDADRQSGHEAAREPEAGRSADAGDRSKQEAERLSVADEGQHGQEAITGEAAKQPWQMTRESFVQAVRDGRDFKQLGVAPTSLSTLRGAKDYDRLDRQASDHHRAAVTTALVHGEQVPAEVLADYHDLQAAKASQQGESTNSKDRFVVERVNQKTNEIETFVFERGEYVKAFMSHDRFDYGEITGISHARREAKIGDGDRWYGFGSIYKTERPAEKPPVPTVPMSKVIEAANTKHGAELGAADRLYTRVEHAEFVKRLNAGEVTADELKATYARFLANKDGIRSELNAKTVKELAPNGAGNLKKSEIVDYILGNMGDRFVVADGFAYSPLSETREQAQQRYVNATTDEQIKEHAERVKKARADRAQAMEEKKKAAENPETLDDFKTYIEIKAGDTMTREQARMTLTPAQRAAFDTLAAEQSREERKGRADQQRAEVRVAATTTEGQIVETKHTKTGEPLFVVKAAERVEREVYNHWNATAKKLGGWYSSFRGNGAVPGFQFKTRENADAFLAFIGGKAEQAREAVQARRDAFEDDRSQTAVERLTEMADRLEARADESLAVERKANTHRRAGMAARAEAAANADKALAKTMRNIAQAIASGKTKFLDRVRQKAQVEMLRGFLATAKSNELRAKFPSYAEQEKHRGETPSIETADYVAFPRYTAYRSDLATMGRQLLDIDGAKKVGAALLKVADDVSVAYQVFAQENLQKVASFKTRDGKPALFSSRADAEAAIARSGFRGKAIVLPFKRGQNLIIMSPSAAREAGVWSGDDDKRITLTADFGEEVVAKVKEFAKYRISMPYLFENVRAERARLKAIGIETAPELRAALREFMNLQAAPPEADKIKQMERAMIGRKNDGLDFFPTPAGVADAMVEAADIKEGMAVLEPSAGMGHIAERIRAAGVEPDVVEMASDRRALLEAKGFNVVGADFLDIKRLDPLNAMGRRTLERELENAQQLVAKGGDRRLVEQAQERLDAAESGVEGYDRIIMNPPFSDRRDAAHVQHAFTLLKPGGRLVAIVGEGVFFGQDKKAQAFRAWLEEVGGTAEKLDEGTFLDPALPANTSANARMVVIDKGAQDGATMASRGAMADTPTTPEGLRTQFAERFPALSKPLDAMLDRGERGERGGLVIVAKAADLPAVFAEKTGAQPEDSATPSQDAGVQALYHAETGLTFLVGEHTDIAAAPGVVLHEVVHGEQGSELAAKIDRRANEMLRLRSLARPAVRELLDLVAERLEQAGAATRENGHLVVNTPAEVAPYLIEEAARAGRGVGFSAIDGKFLSWIDQHLGKSLGNLIRDVVAAIRAAAARWGRLDPNKLTVDDLLAYAQAGMRRAAAGRAQGARAQVQASRAGDASASMEYAKAGLQLLSFIDDPGGIFQYKKAGKDAKTMEAVAAALEEGLKVKPIDTQTITQGKADRAWAITMPDGHQVPVYEKNGRVWINAAKLESGASQGTLLYALVGNYAYNTGKVFIGDPDGLSPVALIRRTENMLSLAIKFGTTRFLYPHAAQVDPKGYYSAKTDIDSGAAAVAKVVQPLRWSDTDDEQNMRNLFLAAYNNAQMLVPEIAHVRYDFVARRFVAEDGSVVAESDFTKISDRAAADLERRGLGALRAKNAILPGREGERFIAGSATQKRAALFQSLAHAGRDERTWGRILDQIGEQLSGHGLDPALRGILYSKAGESFSGEAHQARRGVLQFFGNRKGSLKTFGLYDKTLATQYHKALKDRHYGKVFGYVNAMQNEVSLTSIRPAELAPGILPRVDDVKSAVRQMVRGKRGGKPLKQATAALFAGTLAGDNVMAGKVWTEAELRDKFNLDDTGVALYRQARAAIDASLDELAAAEAYAMVQDIAPKGLHRLVIDDPRQAEGLVVGGLDKQIKVLDLAIKGARLKGNEKHAEDLGGIRAEYLATKRKVEKVFNTAKNLKLAGYAPLMRFGKYTVTVQAVDPTTGASLRDQDGNLLTEYFGKFETQAEARAVQREMETRYADQDILIRSGVDSQSAHELYAGVSPETVALFGDAVGATEVTRKYYQMALSERSALKRRLERKGTAGFSHDLPRVLSTFITSNGRFAAQRYYLRDLNNAIKYIPQEKGDVKDEALRLKQFVMNPKDPGAPISSALFAWFLGGSVASAAVNLTQPIMMTGPYLSQFGVGVASKCLLTALPAALGKKEITDPGLRAALKRASQEGIVDAQKIFHLYTVGAQGVAAGLVSSLARIPGAGGMIKAGSEGARARVNAFLTLWGSMFSLAEGFNRRLTFIAAWGVAKANKEADPYAFAVRAVNETQGIYNKVNRPNWARNPAGRVILTFKQFSIMYIELLSRMWKRGGPEGKRAALIMLAVLMLAAGEEGLPFAQDLDDLVDAVGQLFGFDTNMRRNKRRLAHEILGKHLGDLFLYGASTQLPLDFAGRLGLGNLIPGTGLAKFSNEQGRDREVAEVFGPAAGMGVQFMDAYDAAVEGNPGKALQNLAPKAIKDVVAGAEMARKGYATDPRGRKVVDVGLGDAVMKGFGFNPTKVAQTHRKTMPIQQDISTQKRAESSIVDQWVRGIVDDDAALVEKARARKEAWNNKNPDTPIVIGASQIRARVRGLAAEKSDRVTRQAPREMRGRVGLEMLEEE